MSITSSLKQDHVIKLLQDNNVAFAAIFGSHAKGNATDKSDVDILIEYKKRCQTRLIQILRSCSRS